METHTDENTDDAKQSPTYPAPVKRDPVAVTALVMSIITSVLFALPVLFDFYIVFTSDGPEPELGVGTFFIGLFLSPIALIAFILAAVADSRISKSRYKAKFSQTTLTVTIVSPIVLVSAFMLAMWMNQ